MKVFFGILIFIIQASFVVQAQRVCKTEAYTQQLIAHDAAIKNYYNAAEAQIIASVKKATTARDTAANEIIYIPVVVHILYKSADQNLSKAQVQSQLDVLNNDYGNLNADKINTPVDFKKLAADTRIRFCLAQVDPKGKTTSGIVRRFTTTDNFSADDGMKFSAQGGDDAWDNKRYLNIWVCNMGGRTLGYSSIPGGPANVDGVVIGYDVFGTAGYLRSPFNKGRTATHEIGHWLGLKHVWGDAICGTDEVDDTPVQQYYNYGCPVFPHVTNCSPDYKGDMFMNFMDFTDDDCMNMFTIGQKIRMRALFAKNNLHNSFLQSFACDSTLAQGGALPGADTLPTVSVKESFVVKVYPNPAQSIITVEYKSVPNILTKKITIFNVLGNKVYSASLTAEKTTISIAHFSKGIYIVQIEEGSKQFNTKIIKQ